MRGTLLLVLLLATGVALADDAPKAKQAHTAKPAKAKEKEKAKEEAQADAKEGPSAQEDPQPKEEPSAKDDPNLGMSILGNQEAPKALVIVPWKSSELGASMGISPLLDDSKQPVDREVFLRALSYYAIRSESNATQSTTASRRSK